MSITKITRSELLDFPKDSTSSVNTSGTVIPTGYTNACNFPTYSSGVALYEFENNANDTCGSYNLTEVGSPSYVTGKFGEAIQFNGTSQGATTTSAVVGNPETTISFWYNGNGIVASSTQYIVGFGVGTYNLGPSVFYSNGVFGAVLLDTAGNIDYVNGTTPVSTTTWYHVAFTWDGSTTTNACKVYVNGSFDSAFTASSAASSITYSNFGVGKLGDYGGSSATYAAGWVDQLRIFDTVLTPTQITELYNETTTEEYRPTTSLNAGEFRFNTTTERVEYYDGSAWFQIADEYISGQPTSCICNYPTTSKALYQFEDNVNDTCGSYNGTEIGSPTYVTGKFGKAINLSVSSSQAVDLPDNILPDNSTASSSASIWFKHAPWTSGHVDQTIIDAWNYDVSKPGWTLMISPAWSGNPDGHIYLANYYLGGSAVTGSTRYDDGLWHHAVVVFDQSANKLKLYMDGALYGTETTTASNVWIFTQKAAIGWQNANPAATRYYDGQIDQARIFSTALTETQITELYNEIPCN